MDNAKDEGENEGEESNGWRGELRRARVLLCSVSVPVAFSSFFSVYCVYKHSCNKQKTLHCKKHAIYASTKLRFECI